MSDAEVQKGFESELKSIRDELAYIKDNMAEKDSIMTEDDFEALLAYRKDKHSDNLISHKTLKEELGL